MHADRPDKDVWEEGRRDAHANISLRYDRFFPQFAVYMSGWQHGKIEKLNQSVPK